jgi:SAM-dependent methyltransferase
MPKEYDRAYFEKWYRDPRHRVTSPAALARKVRMVVGIAEYHLGRELRSVLDIGCGEAPWSIHLRNFRRNASYLGLDQSSYAVERYGRSRNVKKAGVHEVGLYAGAGPFDLVICSDVLHYVDDDDLERALAPLAAMTAGVAFLEVLVDEDHPTGDLSGWHRRNAAWYLQRFTSAGLVPCGQQCYLPRRIAEKAAELELRRRVKGEE